MPKILTDKYNHQQWIKSINIHSMNFIAIRNKTKQKMNLIIIYMRNLAIIFTYLLITLFIYFSFL